MVITRQRGSSLPVVLGDVTATVDALPDAVRTDDAAARQKHEPHVSDAPILALRSERRATVSL
jgi:hypothetical protein